MMNDKDLNFTLSHLDLTDPDKIVEFLLGFYDQNEIKNSSQLVKLLKKYKPLVKAADLQKKR